MAKVSVIVPCYNAGAYICKCLDGLSTQTFKDFDVYIVNDCSSDNTESKIVEYKEKSTMDIHYVLNKVNSGPSLSRYNGAKKSKSEWIAFCDSDDWYEETFLEKMLIKAKEDNCDIVFCGYKNIIGDKIDRHPLTSHSRTFTPHEAMILNVDSLCMTLVRRDIYINTPQPDIRNGEDMALVPLLIQGASKVGVLPDILYNYYIRHGSVSLSPNDRVIESLVKSFSYIDTNIDASYKAEKEYLGVRNLIYGGLLNLFKYSYDTAKAEIILSGFEKTYHSWGKNPYIKNLPLFKLVFVKCAKYRLFIVLYILSKLHALMLK